MTIEPPHLVGERVVVRLAETADLAAVVDYFFRNRVHLSEFTPAPSLEEDFWRERIATNQEELREDRGCRAFLFDREREGRVIGTANLTAFVRGPFQACYLGFTLDGAAQGRGLMREGLELLMGYAFDTLNLHRIMANHVPRNQRSAELLKRLGFVTEGQAKDYLRINEVWEDHVLTSLTNPSWRAEAGG